MFHQLTNTQQRYLRGLAHALRPIILVGGRGLTENLIAELDGALEHHELIKVKISAEDRESRDEMVAELVLRSRAQLVQRVGHVATLYRRSQTQPQLTLPR